MLYGPRYIKTKAQGVPANPALVQPCVAPRRPVAWLAATAREIFHPVCGAGNIPSPQSSFLVRSYAILLSRQPGVSVL